MDGSVDSVVAHLRTVSKERQAQIFLVVRSTFIAAGNGALHTMPSTEEGFHAARIVKKQMLSPTVCWLQLQAPTVQTFMPGQWVDFVAPCQAWIGGFSLSSSPSELPFCSLAIKRSDQDPAVWVHEESRVGSEVRIRIGGTCTLKNSADVAAATRPAVFVAGGIGISPILSLYRAHWETLQSGSKSATTMLYSVSTQDELVFGDELVDLIGKYGNVDRGDRLILTLTQQAPWEQDVKDTDTKPGLIEYRMGRQLDDFLSSNMQAMDSDYYICGPPVMLDEAVQILRNQGVSDESINYEKWW
jgi:ferredoxin-NADP reductase